MIQEKTWFVAEPQNKIFFESCKRFFGKINECYFRFERPKISIENTFFLGILAIIQFTSTIEPIVNVKTKTNIIVFEYIVEQ